MMCLAPAGPSFARNLRDGLHFGGLCNFDVAQHNDASMLNKNGLHTHHTPVYAAQTVGLKASCYAASPW